MFFYPKIRLLSGLRKSILKKLRNSLKSSLFSIILLKIIFSDEKGENFKSLKNKKDVKSDLNFRIIDEENKEIKRFDVNIDLRRFFFFKESNSSH